MLYNSTLYSVQNPIAFFKAVDTITNGMFGSGLVMTFGIVIFLALKNYSTERAFATSALLTSILSFLLFTVNLCKIDVVMFASILAILSIFALQMQGEP